MQLMCQIWNRQIVSLTAIHILKASELHLLNIAKSWIIENLLPMVVSMGGGIIAQYSWYMNTI